jgi:branched-chain amino acid transport system permease protein
MGKNLLFYLLVGILFLALLTVPFSLSEYGTYIVTEILIMALFATSLNLLLGFTGLLSFGQAGYFAAGAYGTGIVLKSAAFSSLLVPITVGTLMGLFLAAVIGALCVRLTEFYFALLTLAFSQMIWGVIFTWRSLTGGDDGITGIKVDSIHLVFASVPFTTISFYYLTLVIVCVSLYILWRITESPLGYMFKSIRDNATRAQNVGIPIYRFRWVSFSIAGLFSGLAGSLFALKNGFISPELAHWSMSGEPVLMSLVGGINTFLGPTFGAIIYTVFNTYLSIYTEHSVLFFGLLLIAIVMLLPEGVLGRLKMTQKYASLKGFFARSW